MADAVEVAIEAALLNRLLALTFSPALPVSLPNVGTAPGMAFTPPQAGPGVRWLRANFLPAQTFELSIDVAGSNQHYGLLQVDAIGSIGDGEMGIGRLAADVIAHFKRGTRLNKDGFTIDVIRPPRRGTMVKDYPWVFIPVSIPYLSFAGNP